MVARGRHRRRLRPPVGSGLVHLVRGARAVSAAADRVQAAAERGHREPAARLPERRASRPGRPRLVVLVDGAQRGPAHAAAAVTADHEEAAVDDGGRRVVRRGGQGGARLPLIGRGIVHLDRRDGLAARTEAADHEHPAVDLPGPGRAGCSTCPGSGCRRAPSSRSSCRGTPPGSPGPPRAHLAAPGGSRAHHANSRLRRARSRPSGGRRRLAARRLADDDVVGLLREPRMRRGHRRAADQLAGSSRERRQRLESGRSSCQLGGGPPAPRRRW